MSYSHSSYRLPHRLLKSLNRVHFFVVTQRYLPVVDVKRHSGLTLGRSCFFRSIDPLTSVLPPLINERDLLWTPGHNGAIELWGWGCQHALGAMCVLHFS